MITRLTAASAVAAAMCWTVLMTAQTHQPRRPEVLFVASAADQRRDRLAPVVKTALAGDGFNISYTSDLRDLNTGNLTQYDALMIDGGLDAATPAERQAVTD